MKPSSDANLGRGTDKEKSRFRVQPGDVITTRVISSRLQNSDQKIDSDNRIRATWSNLDKKSVTAISRRIFDFTGDEEDARGTILNWLLPIRRETA